MKGLRIVRHFRVAELSDHYEAKTEPLRFLRNGEVLTRAVKQNSAKFAPFRASQFRCYERFCQALRISRVGARGAGANKRATVGTLLSVGWVPHGMPSSRRAVAS